MANSLVRADSAATTTRSGSCVLFLFFTPSRGSDSPPSLPSTCRVSISHTSRRCANGEGGDEEQEESVGSADARAPRWQRSWPKGADVGAPGLVAAWGTKAPCTAPTRSALAPTPEPREAALRKGRHGAIGVQSDAHGWRVRWNARRRCGTKGFTKNKKSE